MQKILLVGEQGHQKQSWQVKENANPVWDCCVKQGGPKAGCDTIETVLRKHEGWPLRSGLVFRQDLGPMDDKQLNALFGNPKTDTFHAIRKR